MTVAAALPWPMTDPQIIRLRITSPTQLKTSLFRPQATLLGRTLPWFLSAQSLRVLSHYEISSSYVSGTLMFMSFYAAGDPIPGNIFTDPCAENNDERSSTATKAKSKQGKKKKWHK
ncbi:hypothetical protein L596_024665 [Steinernema carpocapsae]|uniref:Uncharacterized protein n=1 Tax=Steinernema carpocapsae TaxID=34508 RepID=A0A4U5M5D7_STECR|nr:hypothetical protein L596_024665 [Steinernema carpocapsae]